ncbi:MAG: hypothetical protein AB2807_09075, partial [Candidatus Sedimenticola endophacoides]
DGRGSNGCRVGESILGTGMSQNLSRGSDTLERLFPFRFSVTREGGYDVDKAIACDINENAEKPCQAVFHFVLS